MSPDDKDEKESREGPPADRERTPRKAAPTKTGKTRSSTPAKRSSTRAPKMTPESKTTTPPIPVDTQDELPPQGDKLAVKPNDGRARPAPRERPAGAPPAPAAPPPPRDLVPPPSDLHRLLAGEHAQPHDWLGAHAAGTGGVTGVIIRAIMPNATAAEAVLEDGRVVPLDTVVHGLVNLLCGFLPDAKLPLSYRLRFHYPDGATWEKHDPYRFLPTLGDVDLHLFNEGTHRRLWEKLGAHVRTMDGVAGVSFAVWAPNAKRVSVVGDFCGWDGRIFPMRSMGASGVYELFLTEIKAGAL